MLTTKPRTRHLSRFDSIIVPHDLSGVADRALPIIGQLARRGGLGVRLVTTSSPGLDATVDRGDLVRHARRIDGWPVTPVVLETNDPSTELAEFADRHRGALICLASHGRSVLGEMFAGSMADELLHRNRGPLLIVGPRVDTGITLGDDVIVGMDDFARETSLLDVARAWKATFGGNVDVFEVPNACDPVDALVDTARQTRGVIAVASHLRRGFDRARRGSVSWDLVRRSPTPVLVIPGHDPMHAEGDVCDDA